MNKGLWLLIEVPVPFSLDVRATRWDWHTLWWSFVRLQVSPLYFFWLYNKMTYIYYTYFIIHSVLHMVPLKIRCQFSHDHKRDKTLPFGPLLDATAVWVSISQSVKCSVYSYSYSTRKAIFFYIFTRNVPLCKIMWINFKLNTIRN